MLLDRTDPAPSLKAPQSSLVHTLHHAHLPSSSCPSSALPGSACIPLVMGAHSLPRSPLQFLEYPSPYPVEISFLQVLFIGFNSVLCCTWGTDLINHWSLPHQTKYPYFLQTPSPNPTQWAFESVSLPPSLFSGQILV